MSKKATIHQLLQQPALWQGSRTGGLRPVMATGYPKLDAVLHDGGWPQGGVSELLLPRVGVGELQLLRPLLHHQRSLGGYQVWVNPPFIPMAEVLMQWGVSLNKLLCIRCEAIDAMVWAAYQALVSKACSVVLIWLPRRHVSKVHLRKLVLGARQGKGWCFVLRHTTAANEPSPSALRLSLRMLPQGDCQITLLKQPGGWSGQQVTLSLQPFRACWTSLSAAEWPVFKPDHQQPIDSIWHVLHRDQARLESWLSQQESSQINSILGGVSSQWH
jgi:protein ImuA